MNHFITKIAMLGVIILSFQSSLLAVELNQTIKLAIGDWSEDGHAKSKDIYIKSNFNKEQIADAQSIAFDILGFSFTNDVAEEYEDNSISEARIQTLLNNNVEVEFSDLFAEEDRSLDIDSYSTTWLKIIKLGNPSFKYKIIETDSWIDIGGYGLFY